VRAGVVELVGRVAEELVVARVGDQLRLRVLLLAEDEARALLVDVEAVLDDGRQLGREEVVVDRLGPRDVDVQLGGLGARVLDRQRAEPQRADDVREVRDVLLRVLHRVEHGAEVALRLLAQVRVMLVRHRVEERGDAALVIVEAEVGCRDDRRVGVP
jgi:hypothetical protein